jgi:hypothetical protein
MVRWSFGWGVDYLWGGGRRTWDMVVSRKRKLARIMTIGATFGNVHRGLEYCHSCAFTSTDSSSSTATAASYSVRVILVLSVVTIEVKYFVGNV